MRILHTADWHIGKRLHKHYLYQDFDLFIGWLCDIILDEKIELVLVSGDVFDLANPSAEARKQYYQALLAIKNLNCKIIITGGNHDSPSMLDAPKELLNALDLNVIGGLPEQIEDCIITLPNSKNPEIVVAALPFLRDADIRQASDGNTYEDRLIAIRKGIQSKFDAAANWCEKNYNGIPAIAMGHLYAAGVSTSESERDIQIGNQAAFKAEQFNTYFKYIALGHIHQPQQVHATVPTYYSGAPIQLSFSERQDEKRVLIIDTKNGFTPKSLTIPKFRNLKKITGTLEQIKDKLAKLIWQGTLTTLIEIELREENYSLQKLTELDALISDFSLPNFEIIKHRAQFSNQQLQTGDVFSNRQSLKDLKPKEVFDSLLNQESYLPEERVELRQTFDELYELLNTND
ncbi:exonuclease SbcCD subunit D C-terminal domain-containing protein [Mesonia sp. HuA40]|uniref:exonuclease SbcCD subunit D C-terminal domain-containing protein n=1 Tax=Mesonia sp. HuA40 TaxID=2602761 RepID=UPI0011C89F55|nr:exonuclease SbcCD subunit D C-terminal domain-containing protein [Mesonia sp. HuA40]TXK71168.1 exonuclease subunit SbcD [Mesonia sp. HuA40]